MGLDDLDRRDRRIIVGGALAAIMLLAGLTISGLWPLVAFRPTADDIVFSGGRPTLPNRPDTSVEIHGALADLTAIFALVFGAWFSYRILARVSRTAVATFIVLTGSVIGGGELFLHEIRPAGADPVPAGSQDSSLYRIEMLPDLVLSLIHLASVPVVVGVVWLGWRLRDRDGDKTGTAQLSWLDHLGR